MKISKFRLIDDEEADDFKTLLKQFNDTSSDYPANKGIHILFDEMAAAYANKVAVRQEDSREITYGDLKKDAGKVAGFLISKGIQPEDTIGLLMDPSVNTIIALLGILKAGAAYVPVSTDYPFDRKKFILNDTAAKIVISERKYITTLNRLQWECPSFNSYICMDSENVYEEEESQNELMKKELWDYVGEEADDDIAGGGWINSYTGEKLSREVMDEYGDNILHKLKPLLKKQHRVLEIGCSSGISMFRLAPLVDYYAGVDLSDEILKKTEEQRKQKGLGNVKLTCCPAHNVDTLNESNFDVIILNSVVQCFNGHNYLMDVITKAIKLLNSTGFIFLGDIMDVDMKEQMLESLCTFKRTHAGKGYTTKVDWVNELFLSRSFFNDLRYRFPVITDITFTDKIGQTESELSAFRFDVLLKIDKENGGVPLPNRTKHQYGTTDLALVTDTDINIFTGPGQLAYIMFTSGTSGNPKGVLVEHGSVVRLVRNTNYISITPDEICLHAAPLSFDASTFEIWGALLNGAGLCTVRKETLLDFALFENTLKTGGVTVGWFTSTLFNNLVDLAPGLFKYYRKLIIGGDVLSPEHVTKVLERYPSLTLINGYGPTENTTFSTCYNITKETRFPVPIGKPVSNSRCYILKENNPEHAVPVGIVGELYVAGDGIARGYLNNPVLTAEKFIDGAVFNEKRLYRTGDRAKWLPDGNIEFIGRVDEQVKIRGFRVEIQEVENKLLKIPGVKAGAVTVRGEGADKQLIAYIVTEGIATEKYFRYELAIVLPDYMIPAYFVFIDHLPLNENGKTDKKALPLPAALMQATGRGEQPRNETEKKLWEIWAAILNNRALGIYDNFFEVGGHSLKATQVISKVWEELAVKISIRDMFTSPSIAGMSELVGQRTGIRMARIERIAEQPLYDLSHTQRRLWVMSRYDKEQIVYNIPGIFALHGVKSEIFDRVFGTMIERYEILRTVFVSTDADGEPRQKILSPAECNFRVTHIDLREMPDKDREVQRLAREESATPFDLETGPLLRIKLLQLDEEHFVFLYTLHHIIADGWSMRVLVNDIVSLYEAYSHGLKNPLPELPIQYKDYTVWLKRELEGERIQEHRRFWLSYLQPPLPVLQLPADFARQKVMTFNGDVIGIALDESLSGQIRAFCKEHQVTLYMLFLAISKVTLSKYASQNDVVVGSPVNGRIHKDLENQIGFFVNMLVIRSHVNAEDSFTFFLSQIKKNVLDVFEHQVYPFDMILDDLDIPRDMSRNPLFDVEVTTSVNDTWETVNGSDRQHAVTDMEADLNIGTKFDVMLQLVDTGGAMQLSVRYNADLFRKRSMVLLKERLLKITREVLNQPDTKIEALDYTVVTGEEKEPAISIGFNF